MLCSSWTYLFCPFNSGDVVGDDNEDEEDDSWIKEEEEEFHSELDRNGDGTLDREEISHWVLPEDSDHIDEEIKHLFSEADQDKVWSQLFCWC